MVNGHMMNFIYFQNLVQYRPPSQGGSPCPPSIYQTGGGGGGRQGASPCPPLYQSGGYGSMDLIANNAAAAGGSCVKEEQHNTA